jgi:hypothetical protein
MRQAPPEDLLDQQLLGTKVVIHSRQIHTRLAGDHAHRRPVETMLHEQSLGCIEDAATGIACGLAGNLAHAAPPCRGGCLWLTGETVWPRIH